MRSGVAENVISRVELYGYIPTERTIRKLADVLGDEVWELFREEDV
jgi:transcriptional regulator with XRE-family HTH domain